MKSKCHNIKYIFFVSFFYATVLDITARYPTKEVNIVSESSQYVVLLNNLATFSKKHKNPDSSPVTESWERNARDCIAKLRKIWDATNNEKKKRTARLI